MDIIFENYKEISEFSRKEIEFVLSFEGAIPSKQMIKAEISICYGVSSDLIALDSLRAVKGEKKANGKARIYSDAAVMKKFEK
ncbi:MAG: hypothetical protein PHV39_08315 [Methanomicrobium sp.]|nr:hypothetical protein [Methanomicrobium sp.]